MTVITDAPPISSWSHSAYGDFQKCKLRAYLLRVEKVNEPPRYPLKPGQTEQANDRGSRIHQSCEDFVSGKSNHLDPDAKKHFGPELEDLRLFHKDGIVSLEGEWGMSRDWTPWNWYGQWVDVSDSGDAIVTNHAKVLPSKGKAGEVWKVGKKLYAWIPAWLRLKLDALIFPNKYEAIAIDYKTGRKFGNEVKHGEQLQLYQLVTFLRYPELEEVTAELWYLDQDEITQIKYRRDQGLRFQKSWDMKGSAMTMCTEFPPNPNIHSCKYCMLGPWEGATGHCSVGRR